MNNYTYINIVSVEILNWLTLHVEREFNQFNLPKGKLAESINKKWLIEKTRSMQTAVVQQMQNRIFGNYLLRMIKI